MKGDFLKLFAFLSSKQSDNKGRSCSSAIACPRGAILDQDTRFSLRNVMSVDVEVDKQVLYPQTIPKRRKTQSVRRNRSLTVAGATTGYVRNFSTQTSPRKPSGISNRRIPNVDIEIAVVAEDFKIEDVREIWRSFKDRNVFCETSIQEGLLTTTFCSTEL